MLATASNQNIYCQLLDWLCFLVQVVHYELPNNSEIFVHRTGRTGRAGKTGTAIVMHTYQQSRAVRGIENDVGGKFKEVRFCIV